MTWRPRCEGCGVFVTSHGHHPDEYRWCSTCELALPDEVWRRRAMSSRFDADRATGYRFAQRRREVASIASSEPQQPGEGGSA